MAIPGFHPAALLVHLSSLCVAIRIAGRHFSFLYLDPICVVVRLHFFICFNLIFLLLFLGIVLEWNTVVLVTSIVCAVFFFPFTGRLTPFIILNTFFSKVFSVFCFVSSHCPNDETKHSALCSVGQASSLARTVP